MESFLGVPEADLMLQLGDQIFRVDCGLGTDQRRPSRQPSQDLDSAGHIRRHETVSGCPIAEAIQSRTTWLSSRLEWCWSIRAAVARAH